MGHPPIRLTVHVRGKKVVTVHLLNAIQNSGARKVAGTPPALAGAWLGEYG
jgi:hypothetical protein